MIQFPRLESNDAARYINGGRCLVHVQVIVSMTKWFTNQTDIHFENSSSQVLESNIAEDGDIQIKISSHSQLLTGDKISTTHGQKGVVRIVPYHELSIIVMEDGTSFVADLYMAVGSVVSRQTVEQIYEADIGWRSAQSGKMAIADINDNSTEECHHLIDAANGSILHEKCGTRWHKSKISTQPLVSLEYSIRLSLSGRGII